MVWEFSPLVGADDGDSPPSTDAQLACLRIRFIIALRELSSTLCQSVIKAMRPCVRIRFIMILTIMMMIIRGDDVGGFKLLPRPTSSSRQYHRQGSPLLTAS